MPPVAQLLQKFAQGSFHMLNADLPSDLLSDYFNNTSFKDSDFSTLYCWELEAGKSAYDADSKQWAWKI